MRYSITVGPKKLPVMFYYIRSKSKNVRGTETKLYVKHGLCKLNMCILYIG